MSAATIPSSHSLHATIRSKLQNSGFKELREIRVCGGAEEIRISGAVRSYYMKAMAGALTITVPGVLHLENDVEVR